LNIIGVALKISSETAVGIVKEVAAAGFGEKWETRMLRQIETGGVDSDVIDIYILGDISLPTTTLDGAKSLDVKHITPLNDD
jgi:hypothetical protein